MFAFACKHVRWIPLYNILKTNMNDKYSAMWNRFTTAVVAVVYVHPWVFPPASTSFNQATWHCAGIGLEMDLGSGWLYLWGPEVSCSTGTLPKLQPWRQILVPLVQRPAKGEEKQTFPDSNPQVEHLLAATEFTILRRRQHRISRIFRKKNHPKALKKGEMKEPSKVDKLALKEIWHKKGWHFSAYK